MAIAQLIGLGGCESVTRRCNGNHRIRSGLPMYGMQRQTQNAQKQYNDTYDLHLNLL
jgi:hypothetical protein